METKYTTWLILMLGFCIHTLGIFWFIFLLLSAFTFVLGILTILYLNHDDLNTFLNKNPSDNPLESLETKSLGLNILRDNKPIQIISPNIKIHSTELKRHKDGTDGKKKGIFGSGFDLLFKKEKSGSKDRNSEDESGDEMTKKWKPFEKLKKDKKKEEKGIFLGEDASVLAQKFSSGNSPKKKKVISGNKQLDSLIHTIIDYIIRDFIDSWFSSLSSSKEFTEISTRNAIEETAINICERIKNTPLLPLLTTKLIDDVAVHCKLYRNATQAVTNKKAEQKKMKLREKLSPQRSSLKGSHRRNKSDTDLNWHLGHMAGKNVANSKFYTEEEFIDPETRLLHAFFESCSDFKDECLDERALETYLTHVTETILYYTLPEQDFDCLILRTFLSTLLANVVFKPLIYMLAEPDFINLQISRQFTKDVPAGEYLIKMIRQCTDIAELRAVRHLITKEMDIKYRDNNNSAELQSLKYAQQLIDLRMSNLQNHRNENYQKYPDKLVTHLPTLSLDEILKKELAISYYLDYLSILNLQKYVIFYLTAQDWKETTSQTLSDINKHKVNRDDAIKSIRDKAYKLYKDYLIPLSENFLQVDPGLIEVLKIKLKDTMVMPDPSWFESICKFIYEKLKNEDVFLNNFYQSAAYKKLLLELEVNNETETDSELLTNVSMESGSDSNSGDLLLDEDDELDLHSVKSEMNLKEKEKSKTLGTPYDFTGVDGRLKPSVPNRLLEVSNLKHARSASDCTEILKNVNSLSIPELKRGLTPATHTPCLSKSDDEAENHLLRPSSSSSSGSYRKQSDTELRLAAKQKLTAKIINTAINVDGQFAVYAIQVTVIEDNQYKSWHIYRRYSKFLELKKYLTKRFPQLGKLPFPAKKAFQNTQRVVLEHRMSVLNQFLSVICIRAENNEAMHAVIRDFLEPDTNDKKMQGGAVIRTLESIVNPFKTGIKTIKNIPDTLLGGISRIMLGNKPVKHTSFLDYSSYQLEQSSDYPALKSALNLLDEVFDLQARSQWLRRGLINRVLGAPWVSYTANKKLINGAKSLIEVDKVEMLLVAVLNSIWPDGKLQTVQIAREENTKLRTRMAARVSLFAFLSDDLKHVVGSETTRYGLLNFFQMLQNEKLNIRLTLVLLNDILKTIFQLDSMTKHTENH